MRFELLEADGAVLTDIDKEIITGMEVVLEKALSQVLITVSTKDEELTPDQLAARMAPMIADEIYQMFKRDPESFKALEEQLGQF